ncbi:hypothetical protein BGM25_03525 [Bacillus sp. FJAT-29953]|nr:hypothetical protein [Bacillus sp. FJAT-29953]
MNKWTRLENLALYFIIEKYSGTPDKTNKDLAELAKQEFSQTLVKRNIYGIQLHIAELKKIAHELNVPDPRHNNDKDFNQY